MRLDLILLHSKFDRGYIFRGWWGMALRLLLHKSLRQDV